MARVLEVVAEQDLLNGADALVLVVAGRCCVAAARRAAVRRVGGACVAPALVGVDEAARRALDARGLAALAALAGGRARHVAFERLPRGGGAALARFASAAATRLAVRAAPLTPAVLAAFPRLTALHVRCGALATPALAALAAALPASLVDLAVAGAHDARDPWLAALAAAPCAPTLASLGLAGYKKITARGVARVGGACVRVATLCLDGGVFDLAAALAPSRDAPAGAFPAVATLRARRFEPARGHAALRAAVARRPALVDVDVNGQCAPPRGATDGFLPVAERPPPYPDLRRLACRGAHLGAVADCLAGANARLLVLDLATCAGAGPAVLASLAARLPALRALSLAAVSPPLADASLAAVLAALPRVEHLKRLDVSHNARLTAAGVRAATAAAAAALTVVARGCAGGGDASSRPAPGFFLGCGADLAAGERAARRDAFACATCGFGPDDVVCARCARTCHAGHDVAWVGAFPMFCDCPTLCDAHVPSGRALPGRPKGRHR